MATKKSTAAARKTTKKPSSTARKTTTKVTTVSAAKNDVSTKADNNLINIVLAEIVGTFILTAVALMAASDIVPLFVGLTLAVLVMIIGGVSGAHVNPAVTFGLWSTRKLKSALVPVYWIAQFIGAMAALLVMNATAGTKVNLDFSHFSTFSWSIFFIELIGTAIFLFGLMSVVNRKGLSDGTRAVGIGLSLFIGVVVSGTFLMNARQQAYATFQTNAQQTQQTTSPALPHTVLVNGATLNPAVALASTEASPSEITGNASGAAADEKRYSRLGLETILSTLIGAALGANLALLVAYRFRQ